MKVKADRDESSPYAAMLAAQDVAEKCKAVGITAVHVKIRATGGNKTKTPGPGAQSALRAMARAGMKIGRIGECSAFIVKTGTRNTAIWLFWFCLNCFLFPLFHLQRMSHQCPVTALVERAVGVDVVCRSWEYFCRPSSFLSCVVAFPGFIIWLVCLAAYETWNGWRWKLEWCKTFRDALSGGMTKLVRSFDRLIDWLHNCYGELIDLRHVRLIVHSKWSERIQLIDRLIWSTR